MATTRDVIDSLMHRRGGPNSGSDLFSTVDPYALESAETSAAVTPQNYSYPPGHVLRYGAVGDGSTDNTTAFQAAVAVANVNGGVVYFPTTPGNRYVCSGTLTVSNPVTFKGDGKWATNIRYTGTGAFIQPGVANGNNVKVEDLCIQLTGTNAIGIDASRFISSTFRSLRIVSISGTGQTGISANLGGAGSASWTSYFNVVDDVTFDSLPTGLLLQSTAGGAPPTQQPNRWRIIAPTFLNCGNCLDFEAVNGVQVVAPCFDQQTLAGIKCGQYADGVSVTNAMQETAAGGYLLDINAATNRLQVIGVRYYAGLLFKASNGILGTRGLLVAQWDDGFQWSGSSTDTAVAEAVATDDHGLKLSGIEGLSSTSAQAVNLCGTNTFATAATQGVSFARTEPDLSYRVLITGTANETFWVTNITTGGFTAHSSNAASTAQFFWFIVR